MRTSTTEVASGATWRFVRHYLEMVAVMMLGMAALGAASALVVDLPDRTGVRLVEMAVWMAAPMTAWMRVRGHGWRACTEMAAAMLLPAAGALALLATGALTDAGALFMVEHTVVFVAMFAAMLLRREEYAGHDRHHATAPATT
jgi:flagellar biosynthetic protein FliP